MRIAIRVFIICVLIIALAIAGIVIYVKFFGKSAIEGMLSKALHASVIFDGIAIDSERWMISFENFSIRHWGTLSEDVLKAKKISIYVDKEKLINNKAIIFNEVYIENATLAIERNVNGITNVTPTAKTGLSTENSTARQTLRSNNNAIYNFANTFRKIIIKNSVVKLKDSYTTDKALVFYFDNFNLEFSVTTAKKDVILAQSSASLRVPMSDMIDGSVAFNANMAIYKDNTDAEGSLDIDNVNAMLFLPYFDKYTPFNINSGYFNSNTTFRIHNKLIDCPTTMLFNNLRFSVKPGMNNSQFLETAVNKLVPYLSSDNNGIVFDFVVKGSLDKPRTELGPRVKTAISMAAIEEVSKAIQQIRQLKK